MNRPRPAIVVAKSPWQFAVCPKVGRVLSVRREIGAAATQSASLTFGGEQKFIQFRAVSPLRPTSRLAAVCPRHQARSLRAATSLRPSVRSPRRWAVKPLLFNSSACVWRMSDTLKGCSSRGCTKAAAIVVLGQLYCVEHALERERKLPPPQTSPPIST